MTDKGNQADQAESSLHAQAGRHSQPGRVEITIRVTACRRRLGEPDKSGGLDCLDRPQLGQ
jgi:hypothetical protein